MITSKQNFDKMQKSGHVSILNVKSFLFSDIKPNWYQSCFGDYNTCLNIGNMYTIID